MMRLAFVPHTFMLEVWHYNEIGQSTIALFLFHQFIILRSIIRKYLWIESLDEIGEEAMRLKSAEFAIRSLCEVAE